MFESFSNVTYTPSTHAAIADNLDWSLSGTSKKMTFTSIGDKIDIAFTAANITSYDELTMQIYTSPNINGRESVFSITINSVEYTFDELIDKFHHLLFDTEGMTAIAKITITAKVDGLTMFFDLLGYRKVTFASAITDVVKAIAATISLNYNVSTTLSATATAGTKIISLTSNKNICENTVVRIDNKENVELKTKEGDLKTALAYTHASGKAVSVVVPIKWGNYKSIDNDPVCGIVIYDHKMNDLNCEDYVEQGYRKRKQFMGEIFVMIYIECSSEMKLFELASQYEFNYGEQFNFILDGQKVELISIDKGSYVSDMIGNFPRVTFRYSFMPQPYTIRRRKPITTINLTTQSAEAV